MYSNDMSAIDSGEQDKTGPADNPLGRMIRAKRLELGLTQKQVEARSNGVLSQNYQSQVERGEVGMPGFDMLGAFAGALGLNLNNLKIAAGYPVVVVEGSARLTGKGTLTARGSVQRPRAYYEQLAAQALDELAPDDWDDIEAMLEERRRKRREHEG